MTFQRIVIEEALQHPKRNGPVLCWRVEVVNDQGATIPARLVSAGTADTWESAAEYAAFAAMRSRSREAVDRAVPPS